jgi:hypothetical protein
MAKKKGKASAQAKGKAIASRRHTAVWESSPPTPTSSISEDLEFGAFTDVQDVDSPVVSQVHKHMFHSWRVNKEHPMWLIFDSVNPARRFKRDMPYDEDADYPDLDPDDAGDVTETDLADSPQMPFMPAKHT